MASQFLSFSKRPSVNGLLLFEVTEDLLKEVTAGGTLVLRGQAGTDAVVCTDSTTYQLREIQNSNTCMLLPPSSTDSSTPSDQENPRIIKGLVNCHYDITKIFPRLHQLKSLLYTSPFTHSHDRVLLQLYQYKNDVYNRITSGSPNDFSSGLSINVPIGNEDGKRLHHETALNPTTSGLKVNSNTLPHVSGYSLEELSQIVQSSSRELHKGLIELAAISIEGLLCVVDPPHMDTVHDALVDIIGAERWGVQVDVQQVVQELLADGVCSPVVAAAAIVLAATPAVREQMTNCLNIYRESMRSGVSLSRAFDKALDNNGSPIEVANLEKFLGPDVHTQLFAFLPAKVELSVAFFAQFKAKQILRQQNDNTMLLSEFLSQWNTLLPPSLKPEPSHLSGVALVEDPLYNPIRGYKANTCATDLLKWEARSKQATVTLFDMDTLSQEAPTRFDELFTFRTQWTVPAIRPYVERFTGPGLSLDQLLLKYARAIKVGPGAAEQQTTVYTWK